MDKHFSHLHGSRRQAANQRLVVSLVRTQLRCNAASAQLALVADTKLKTSDLGSLVARQQGHAV
ncbi:Uncharacterised protein [Vibrio cholerae]|nr:Uncharacterised protein [Vibrio cholerae]